MWIQEVADLIIGPVIDLLAQIVGWLGQANLVAARGMDLQRYAGPFVWMGPAWLGFVKQLLLVVSLVASVLTTRTAYSLYLAAKSGVKWW